MTKLESARQKRNRRRKRREQREINRVRNIIEQGVGVREEEQLAPYPTINGLQVGSVVMDEASTFSREMLDRVLVRVPK